MDSDLCEGEAEWEGVEGEQMVRVAGEEQAEAGPKPRGLEMGKLTGTVVLDARGAKAQEAERRSHGPGSGLDPGFHGEQGLARLSCDPSVGEKGQVSGVREHRCPLPLLESADEAPAHISVCEIRGEKCLEALGPWVLMGADSLECL